MAQDVEEEEEADEHPVRQNIRETLEVGVRRMNLNAAAVKETGGGGAGSSSGSRRELENRIKKVDRLQSQIEQSFRTVKKEFLKGTSQGKKKKTQHFYWQSSGSGCFWSSWIRSVSQGYGSGSSYHQEKIVKNLMPTVFVISL
jgi:hypothetical protein